MQIQKALVSERTAPAERKKVRNNMDFKVLLETIDRLDEKITKDTPMGDVIDDFQKSKAPQFKGKSQEKRRQMALAAKLSKESTEDLDGIRKLSGLEEADSPEVVDFMVKIANSNDGGELMDQGLKGKHGPEIQKALMDMYDSISSDHRYHPDDDFENIEDQMLSNIEDDYGTNERLAEDIDLSDKTEELTQWFIKYDGYRGDNGDQLPMGWIKSMTATGVGPDGWEVKEWSRYQDKLGKDITDMDDEEIDAFLNDPNNSPITSAMIDDLLKITGASTADEDLARAVSSAIGIGESVEEGAVEKLKLSPEMQEKVKNATEAELERMAFAFGGDSLRAGDELDMLRKAKAELQGKKDEGFDRDSFRKAFEEMVESKFKKGDKVTVDGKETEITVPDGPGPLVGVKKDGKTDMVKADKVKKKSDESVEEGKSKHPKGSEKYKKQMAAKHAAMNEDEMDMDMEIDANMDMPVDPDQEMSASPEQVIDQADEIDMAMGQLEFMKYAAEEIKGHFKMGFEMEEWFQNKLARVHGTMMTLYAYMQGEEGKAGMNESVDLNESIERLFQEEKLGFEDAVRVVRESGGQQTINFVDTALYKWATRVANQKFEGRKAELYAGLLYERNGGDFEITDVLNESE